MKVLITGGAGFLGQRLARELLARGELKGPDGQPQPITELVLMDVVAASGFNGDNRVRAEVGDIAERSVLERLIDDQTSAIFHLAAIVSGQAEADFDLGVRDEDAALVAFDLDDLAIDGFHFCAAGACGIGVIVLAHHPDGPRLITTAQSDVEAAAERPEVPVLGEVLTLLRIKQQPGMSLQTGPDGGCWPGTQAGQAARTAIPG